MIVLGLDPGLAATGYGVVSRLGREIRCLDFGCIKTSAREETATRLKQIYDGVSDVIQRWSPQLVVLEEVFIKGAAPSAALSIGQVRGVLLLAASQHGCKVNGLAPRSAKLAVTGSGTADKSQLERSLRRSLRLSQQIKPEHAADALGIAYVGAMRSRDGGRLR